VWIFSAMATCMGYRYIAIKNDVKLHTWDTTNDGLGVTVRGRRNTKPVISKKKTT